ncbi:MAG: hypothetical protein QNJ32_19845 [Xenococcaceae cyanobacterium MO_167.B27]|nr:hypothetical protein [Xenococcaceae cyanobacterium MO_167.B27]
MEEEYFVLPSSESDTKMEQDSNNIENIEQLATKLPQKIKPYQEKFIEEKSYKAGLFHSKFISS